MLTMLINEFTRTVHVENVWLGSENVAYMGLKIENPKIAKPIRDCIGDIFASVFLAWHVLLKTTSTFEQEMHMSSISCQIKINK